MTSERWKYSKTTMYNIGFHLIWCPKYRRNVLENEIETRLKELLIKKADGIGVTIEEMKIMPDHVHLFVKSSPVMSPHWIVQQFKGYTSRILRQEFSELTTRIPTLWTRNYYCESVGHISEEAVKIYLEEQKHK